MSKLKEITVSTQQIKELYSKKSVTINTPMRVPTNAHCIFQAHDSSSKALVRYRGGDVWTPIEKDLKVGDMFPRDSLQSSFVSSLNDSKIPLNVAIGPAGTGKTSLAVCYAADRLKMDGQAKWCETIYLSKPLVRVGDSDAIGTLPNGLEEKIAPYMASYNTVLQKAVPSSSYRETMLKTGDIQYMPLEFVRGQTFENCVFILDEFQNTSWHMINTLISRMGPKSKLILLGDLNQIDIELDPRDTGAYQLIHSPPFLNSNLSSVVELTTQYRSPMCQLATEVHTWLHEKKKKKSQKKSNETSES